MRRRILIWQIFPSFLAVVIIVLAVVGWYSAGMLRRLYFNHTREMLIAICDMVEASVADMLASGTSVGIDEHCKNLGRVSGVRITVILPDGSVVGDSDQSPAVMGNHLTRPEVAGAMTGGVGTSQKRHEALDQEMLYVAQAVLHDGRVIGVVRTSLPLTAIESALSGMYRRVALAGVIAAVLAGGGSFWIAARINRPVAAMREAAGRFASGDFSVRADIPESAELAALAAALNDMANRLRKRLEDVTLEKNELATVLTGMVEGVLAFDADARVVNINKAAAEFLEIDEDRAKGKMVQEVVRFAQLQDFVEKAVGADAPQTRDIVLADAGGRSFQLRGAPLPAGGAVIVMNDVTELRRLENIRRDFVANVSHELRTPVTSIKGFIETLQEHGTSDPEETGRFLDIIARHTDRLGAIIEDLLNLSQIEDDGEKDRIPVRNEDIKPLLAEAIELSAAKAAQKSVVLQLLCDDSLRADVNGLLLAQAIVNLIDNAVKYSDSGSTVTIEAQKTRGKLEISVKDNGCGIAAEHLDRIFERFYVVDKARSRKLGGTGLGLAIVKHIAQSHGGTVSVTSEVGKGSTFTVRLPDALNRCDI
ncbi:MAG TPA: ATP-binding protein [Sedimentisphaerales bacterium]|nr:ATP-binding protein [Sedimentisphaerales bacterium]